MADDASEDEAGDRSAPLGDLAERVRFRQTEGEAAADGLPADEGVGLEEYFRAETYEAVEADRLWASIDADPVTAPDAELGDEPDEHVVSKRSYCEGCEYFSEPPAVHCTHPGTTIVEFVDTDHIRVRNCPIVAERRAVGEEDQGRLTPRSFGRQ